MIINVASTTNFFDFGEFANSLTAHNDYDKRIIQIIANGIGTTTMSNEVKSDVNGYK